MSECIHELEDVRGEIPYGIWECTKCGLKFELCREGFAYDGGSDLPCLNNGYFVFIKDNEYCVYSNQKLLKEEAQQLLDTTLKDCKKALTVPHTVDKLCTTGHDYVLKVRQSYLKCTKCGNEIDLDGVK